MCVRNVAYKPDPATAALSGGMDQIMNQLLLKALERTHKTFATSPKLLNSK